MCAAIESIAVNADSTELKSCHIQKGRLIGVTVTEGSLYFGSLSGLYFLWYKDYPQSAFHFFNDNGEWLQMDKLGHVTTAYYVSRILHAAHCWAGVSENASIWIGSAISFTYLLNIELLDAFSSEWGFSYGDLVANTIGCALFMGQQFGWHDQRFTLKYSFHPTEYAQYRPDLLGASFIQQMVKDYNGMSFWLSGNIHSFLPEQSKFPRWLNIAIGYGAEGMTGATGNPDNQGGLRAAEFERYRKFFLSVDIDLTRIRTRSSVLKGIFNILGFIKVPAPAIEFNTKGQFNFYFLYF
jgi:hypothetical protein